MEPFLKAVGGKRWLSTKLAAEIMQIDPMLYVEPFVGGGAVALALPPTLPKRVYDANPAFVAVWRVLKERTPEEVLTELHHVERSFPNTAFGYVQARDMMNMHLLGELGGLGLDPRDPKTLQLAALALYINVRSFNGLWRVNADGGFNVPWGKYQAPRRFTLAELTAYRYALQAVDAEHRDFREALDRVRADVSALLKAQATRAHARRIVVFADPPYDSIPTAKSKSTFVKYTTEGFDETDQRDLARWLKYLADFGVRVFATNADTPLIREIYNWAQIEAITEQHTVGPTGARRGQRNCLLIRSR